MEYKPSDFFVGVVDLFGVLMPGAIATYLLRDLLLTEAERLGVHGLAEGASGWVGFAVGAYVLGHLIFLCGALLDYPFDGFRKLLRRFSAQDRLYTRATSVRERLLGESKDAINTFKFAKVVMQLHHEGAGGAIARLEADSKFFRSLCVVITALLIFRWGDFDRTRAAVLIVLLLLCLWRYGERRWKSNELAFGCLVAHDAAPRAQKSDQATPESEERPAAEGDVGAAQKE